MRQPQIADADEEKLHTIMTHFDDRYCRSFLLRCNTPSRAKASSMDRLFRICHALLLVAIP